ncbi:unnamed protein product [Tetraodon nigroviridis]|uniref:(spotted green pufferfish) hypothetical protein n=1 Tax=Tetraodon nigroviridis TaxID=99883 RepID=Q4TB71_TETNG|nr:unnamed protein product [Tetraodon nigroviridis]
MRLGSQPQTRIQEISQIRSGFADRKHLSKMKTLLLLVLPLVTGAQRITVTGCTDEWLEFSTSYPDKTQRYDRIRVDSWQLRSDNTWENLLLYHDTETKTVTVGIKQGLQDKKFEITFYPENTQKIDDDEDDDDEDDSKKSTSKKVKVKVRVVTERCQTQAQTVKTAAGETVPCDPPRWGAMSELFFCKENSNTCAEMLSTRSSERTIGSFTLKETDGNFSIFISQASSRDNGVYWCASKTELYRAGLQKITIKVKDRQSSTAAPPRPTSASPQSHGSSAVTVAVSVVVCAAALLLTALLVYKWRSRSGLSVWVHHQQEKRYLAKHETSKRPGEI